MELRAGYKKTEVGLIPDDWLVGEFGQLIKKISSGKSSTDSQIGDFPIYGSTGIIGWKNYFDYSGEKVLVARVGANAGTVNRVTGNYCVSDNTLMISYGNGFDISFSYFQLISFKLNTIVFGSGQPLITGGQLKQLALAYPPTLEEQTAIANALSDADALIGSLQKLIAKKRQIKQGAMQELLQPKEDWSETTIFQIADSRKDLFDDGDWIESEHITDKGIRLIQTGNIGVGSFIEKEDKKYIYEESFEKLGCKLLRAGDLLICRLAEPAGRACIFPGLNDEKVITSVDVTIYRPRSEVVCREFLNQIFATKGWFKLVGDLCGGTTHKRISRGALGRIKISIPEITEQNRIAVILSSMDAEIAALESKLAKYQQIKQGMMQNLLTGRTRLV